MSEPMAIFEPWEHFTNIAETKIARRTQSVSNLGSPVGSALWKRRNHNLGRFHRLSKRLYSLRLKGLTDVLSQLRFCCNHGGSYSKEKSLPHLGY